MKITQDVRDYAATLNDQQVGGAPGSLSGAGSSATQTSSLTREAGMPQMSEKFKTMGSQVYVDAAAVKESNKAL